MSQPSQFSDAYPSSLYEGDATDNLNFLPSDDLPYSQQTTNSVSDFDFLRPPQPPPIPLSLQRVGPTRKKAYILFSEMANDNFVTWWLQTDFGRKKRIRWDARHQSEVWKHFEQVAHSTDGEPKVMCKRCGKLMDHPQASRNGTSTMMKHFKGMGCQNSTKQAARQPNIKQLMKDTVSVTLMTLLSSH